MDDWDIEGPPRKQAGAGEQRPIGPPRVPPAPVVTHADPTTGVEPPASRSPRRRVWRPLGWVAAALALLLLGTLVGFFVARSQSADDSRELLATRDELALVERALSAAEERNWMYYQETESLKLQLEQAQSGGLPSTSTTASGSAPGRAFGDGVYLVGEDIFPGTYDGVVTGEVGYWARLKGTDGIVASIITNGLPRGPFVLTIVESDRAVELRGVILTGR